MNQRRPWIDVCKGLGIILVVLAHALLASSADGAEQFARAIYHFHMPLFFILAGLTMRPEPLRQFSIRKASTLLVPYVLFLAGLGIPALVISCGLATEVPALGIDRCPIMPIKLILGGSSLGGILGTFWFVPCLYLALLLAQAMLKALSTLRPISRCFLYGSLVLIAYGLPLLIPFSTQTLALGIVPMAAIFVTIGYCLAHASKLWTKTALAIAFAIAALALALPAPFDMKWGLYGTPILGVLGAAALSCLLIGLSRALTLAPPIARPLQFLGQNTLTILYLHQAVHLCLRLAGMSNDTVLVVLSLGVPLLFNRPLIQATTAFKTRFTPDLSPKSPPA